VDGQTWRHYGEQLEDNLRALAERVKRGAYRAKPVRKVYIPKADGRQRPLGVTAQAPWSGQARNVQFSGFDAYLRQDQSRTFYGA